MAWWIPSYGEVRPWCPFRVEQTLSKSPDVPTHKWGRKMMVETEDTYGWLLDACAEVGAAAFGVSQLMRSQVGPTLCPLSKANDTAAAIAARVDDYLDQLYRSPVPVSNHSRPGILTSGQARGRSTLTNCLSAELLQRPCSRP